MTATGQSCDRLLRVRGTVQGVGFRPFVVRVATALRLRGWVRNDAHGVLLRVAGDPAAIDRLAEEVAVRPPPAARVMSVEPLAIAPDCAPVDDAFVAIESAAAAGEIQTSPPADLALCADCRRELADPANRRHGYVFVNCTQCGPRYSIIESLPYDRPRTTMRAFALCPACEREYRDPLDRRFHAEPNACPVCGPSLTLTDDAGTVLGARDEALSVTVTRLRAGGIVAVKGLGGFHLMCDATREAAVAELRRRKRREEKPFAVMFRDLTHLREYAEVGAAAEALLESPQSPVVLVPRLAGTPLAPTVAPGNPWVGALLASTPLHVRLLAALPFPVVATSANLSEEPLCTDDAEARVRLAGIADVFLGHNRPIARPVDDSVVRFTSRGMPLLLRRARGYAPSPLGLPGALPAPVLCVGGHMKNTVAIASGDHVVLSPHIGDLGGAATRAVFTRTIDMLGTLFAARPAAVVCDKHPDYGSTRHAESLGLPVIRVQHHLAHMLAVLLEHGRAADDVIGIAWDGTGYGEDGTIWGGEFIRISGGRATRFARLRPFRLPGGEAAVRDVRRTAVALVEALGDADASARSGRALGISDVDLRLLRAMMAGQINAPQCSSVGRLFDGVGALLGLRRANAFEGQTPLAVEIAALAATGPRTELPFTVRRIGDGAEWEIDWRPAIAALVAELGVEVDLRSDSAGKVGRARPIPPDWSEAAPEKSAGYGDPALHQAADQSRATGRERSWSGNLGSAGRDFPIAPERAARLAAAFHRGLVRAAHAVVRFSGVRTAVLCGGCFQNALLHDLATDMLAADDIEVLAPYDLPANDGAIAAGQALAALWNLTTVELPAPDQRGAGSPDAPIESGARDLPIPAVRVAASTGPLAGGAADPGRQRAARATGHGDPALHPNS